MQKTRKFLHALRIIGIILSIVTALSLLILGLADGIHGFKSSKRALASFNGETPQAMFAAYIVPDSTKVNREKNLASALRSAGLVNSKTFGRLSAALDAPIIKKYQDRYGLQFVSKEMLTKIYHQFGLVTAPIDRYKDEIPEENIIEMTYNINLINKVNGNHQPDFVQAEQRDPSYRFIEVMQDGFECTICNKFIHTVDMGKWELFHSGQNAVANLQILAKPEQLNLDGLGISDDGFVFAKDPMILAPVKEGYIILTAWE